ncbi:glycoside hydrolase family 25 protein [Sulfitobacter donghicola]|uniref:Glycoside hydrolase n=1 Tax=Sulfitobacter donghicola DSW-25 = KCTC 12864 = JCM 14565 TaxID=1300350 RepID=A0A073IHJ8_9RHOB|nr:GH25 family lysozyme [Sulfitobacter donghicola]KEJ88981.1 glycoside hydrolase [Sulfitobacter donghicola DSW-25 = KCTC 12864 = JCM 14565]KIN67467.1 Glycoside hydrolase, family 25 [Sulfitobacter donghicola DSW-25 = KCTC 12864 = JCM 14565]
MKLRTTLSALLITVLAACGGGGKGTAIPVGEAIAPNFRDADPVNFKGQKPSRYPVHGIDAARFQKSINWGQARRNGVNFAFIKATEGGDLLDPGFKSHWRGAGHAGVARGAYHFYYFCTAPEVQARWFIRNVPKTKGMLPPVLDMEWNPFSPTCAHRRPEASVVQDEMRRWLKIVEAHYGQRPIIYTTPRFYKENKLSGFRGYEYWLRTTAKSPREAYPGQGWRFWQYSATGLIDGIQGEVDLNAFSGSKAEWNAWMAARAAQ